MQWMQNLSQWFNGMTPWFALSAGLAGLIAYAVGLKSVLGIMEKVLDVVSPILKFVAETLVACVKWSWNTIFWPGLKDILDSWVTILTVVVMGLMLWGYMDHKVDNMVDQLEFCQSENVRLDKLAKKQGISTTQPGPLQWLWPW